VRDLWLALNRQAPCIFCAGLLLAALWHLHQWRRDAALLARQRQQPAPPPLPPDAPLVSVLVAAWNEAEMIERHIRSFLALRYPAVELLLCAGGADDTYALARAYECEQVIVLRQQPGEGKQAALRRCLRRAAGEIIYLTDADSLLDDESFAGVLAPLLLEGEDAATGSSRPLDGQLANPFVIYQWCADLFVEARRPQYVAGLLGRNAALRRAALDAAGGFDAPVATGTDYVMAKRLLRQGYRIRYAPHSAVRTTYPDTARSYWRRQSRWVRNLMVHGPSFGAWDEVRQAYRTALVGLAMLLLPWLSLALGPLLLALWGVLFGAGFLAKLRYARFARLYRGAPISWRQLLGTPLFMLVDFVAWSLPLLDLVVRRRVW